MHSPDAPALSLRSKVALLLPGWWGGATFALQGMVATTLALWVCILLNLKTPYTAALTVWVVANSRHSHVLAKSFHRVGGTLLGGAVSVALIGWLGSTPELLLVCLALWLGICTALGNLLRHYRSYFGFLAGYTAAFVVLGGYHHPDHVLETALDRTASIVIGVLSISLVLALTGKREAVADTMAVLRKLRVDCMDVVSRFREIGVGEWTSIRLRLNADLLQAEDHLEHADIESHGFRGRARRHWHFSRFLIDLAEVCRCTARRMDEQGLSEDQRLEVQGCFGEVARSIEPAATHLTDSQLQCLKDRLEEIADDYRTQSGEKAAAMQPLIHFLERWFPLLEPAEMDRGALHLPRHLDLPGAFRHGLRTTLALLLAIGFWVVSGWSEGPVFVFNCAAFCALNAGMSHPGKSLGMIAVSATFATVAGFLLKFHLLPMAGGFPALILCLAVVLVPIAFMTRSRNPWVAVTGATGGFLVLALVQPANHMTYDPAAYLSSSIAMVFAALFAIPVFGFILPNRPAKEPARLLRVLRRKVARLSSRIWPASAEAWRVTSGDLLKRMQLQAFTTPQQLGEGLRLVDLGIQWGALRRSEKRLKHSPDCRAAIDLLLGEAAHASDHSQPLLCLSDSALQAIMNDRTLGEALRREFAVPLEECRFLLSTPTVP